MGNAQHGHTAFLGQIHHDVEYFLDHFGVKRRCRLVEQHDLGIHAQGARNSHALLLPARQLTGKLRGLFGNTHTLEKLHGGGLGFGLGFFQHPDGPQRKIFKHGQVREKVEMLEHHADIATDDLDVFEIVGKLGAVDNDTALLMLFKTIDAANHG